MGNILKLIPLVISLFSKKDVFKGKGWVKPTVLSIVAIGATLLGIDTAIVSVIPDVTLDHAVDIITTSVGL